MRGGQGRDGPVTEPPEDPGTTGGDVFAGGESLAVGDVCLSAADPPDRLREKLARVVLDEMYQFVALLDRDGRVLEVNRAALDGAGIHLSEIRGRPFWETRWWAVSREAQAKVRDAIRRAAAGEFVRFDVENYGAGAGHDAIVVDFSLNPVRDASGRVVYLLPEGRNITEKKKAEAEIARKTQELQVLLERVRELDETKSRFFANVSHELRTPLALILGPVEGMLGGRGLAPGHRRDLEVVRRNAATLLKHVNDLLDVARLDAGQMSLRRVETDLAHLVRLMASHFEALAPQRDITFVVSTPASLPAEVDPDKLRRVLLNLLSNAFKFTPRGGRIRIALSVCGEGRALVEVQDSGPGVPPDLRGVIFERFRQAHDGSDRVFGGTGLGLSIARDFVELHGGIVSVTDAPGGGALFQVEVPLRAPEGALVVRGGEEEAEGDGMGAVVQGTLAELHPAPPEAVPPGPPGDGRPRVLVVEDNADLRRFLAEALAGEFVVETAADGREGLERILARPPDVVLTDLMMPRLSGDRMIAEVRARPELDAVPVLVLSARADDALRLHLLAEGAQDYVVKPFPAAEVLLRVRNLAAVKRARDVLEAEIRDRSLDLEVLAKEVSRRKRQAEDALEEARVARAAAEAADRAKSAFLSLVSHEMRTPLTAILLTLQHMDRQGVTPGDVRHHARMTSSTLRLNELVTGLLDYARFESGRLSAAPECLDLPDLAADVVEEIRVQARAKGLDLRLDASPGVPPITGDRRLLRLVVSNLVGNAVKYTPRGEVVVTVGHGPRGHVVAVRDTGPGIPEEDRGRVFEPFEQLEDVRHKSVPGVGLGLALVKRVVGSLGGDVSLEVPPEGGCVFTVVLPPSGAAGEDRDPFPVSMGSGP